MKKLPLTQRAGLLLIGGLAFVSQLQAGTVTWINTGGSAWINVSNWSIPSAPGAGDIAQFGANPTSATGLGIKMDSASTNNGPGNQAVGAIEISSARTSGNVTLGDSASTSGILTLNGASVNGVNDVILHNASSKTLTLQPSNGGTGVMTVALGDSTNNIIQLDAGSITVGCNITETGAGRKLTIAGASTGAVSLTGNNSFSGGFYVLGSEVDVSSDSGLGAASNNITLDGGRLGSNSGLTFAIASARNIYLGATVGTSFSVKGATGDVTYNGVFQDKDGGTQGILVKQGAGILDVGGVSTYTGNTSINNGTLRLNGSGNRLPTGTVVNIGQTASTNLGVLDLNGFNQEIAGLTSTTGTNASASLKNTVTSTAPATLTLGGNGSYAYGDGTAANSGIIAGAISLLKQGGGTQTLGDTNTYTGTTTVAGGALILNGSLTNTSSLTVNGGTVQLGIDNAIVNTARLTLGGGVLAAANHRAAFADLTNTGDSTLDLGVGSTAAVLNFGDSHDNSWLGTLTVLNWNGNSTGGGGDEVFFGTSAGGLTGGQLGEIIFLDPTIDGVARTGSFGASILGTGEIVAVPEPGTWTSLLVGLGALGFCRRRRQA
jgi:autotransporter-associated beta strand protein